LPLIRIAIRKALYAPMISAMSRVFGHFQEIELNTHTQVSGSWDFSELQAIRSLDYSSGYSVNSSALLEFLRHPALSSLERLRLGTWSGLHHLESFGFSALPFIGLKSVELPNAKCVEFERYLESCPEWTQLNHISSPAFLLDHFLIRIATGECPELKSIKLIGDRQFANDGIRAFVESKAFTQLEHLTLTKIKFQNDFWDRIAGDSQSSPMSLTVQPLMIGELQKLLRSVVMSRVDQLIVILDYVRSGELFASLSEVKQAPKLRSLVLRSSGWRGEVREDDFRRFCESSAYENLLGLELSERRLTLQHLEYLSQSPFASSLRYLKIRLDQISVEEAEEWLDPMLYPNLLTLKLDALADGDHTDIQRIESVFCERTAIR
jgi:hypothetical protein